MKKELKLKKEKEKKRIYSHYGKDQQLILLPALTMRQFIKCILSFTSFLPTHLKIGRQGSQEALLLVSCLRIPSLGVL